MYDYDEIFGRTALIAGDGMMRRLQSTRVIVFGVGGVGSWAAESLVRSGIGHIAIVDSDNVAVSNINRQLPALVATVGRPKVEVLATRFTQINPYAEIEARRELYTPETADTFALDSYDYIIDAIDSLRCKADLIVRATASRAKLFASMGAALKVTGSMIAVDEFWNIKGCPLARALRNKFKRTGTFPQHKFKCVYSPERVDNRLQAEMPGDNTDGDTWSATKAAINGTFAHATAIFGNMLAGLVIEDIYNSTR